MFRMFGKSGRAKVNAVPLPKKEPQRLPDVSIIESLLAPGMVVEVRKDAIGNWIINVRPEKEMLLQFPNVLKCTVAYGAHIDIAITNPDDNYPVILGTMKIPGNYWIEGVTGYKET